MQETKPNPTSCPVFFYVMVSKACSQEGTEERFKKTKVYYTTGPRNRRISMPLQGHKGEPEGGQEAESRSKTKLRQSWVDSLGLASLNILTGSKL